jgi:hypothetical protein
MIHSLKPSDQVAGINLAVNMLERIDTSSNFLCQVCFSDETMLNVSGAVNSYNCRICWASQNPHVICELESGSPEVKVWAGLMYDKLKEPFLFSQKAVTGRSYLNILELHALPQLRPQTIL